MTSVGSGEGVSAVFDGKEGSMLMTLAMVFLILWLLGMVTSATFGGFLHILIVVAIVVVLVRIISGRSPA
jgi:predicted membrane-bound spermidine synthase